LVAGTVLGLAGVEPGGEVDSETSMARLDEARENEFDQPQLAG